MKRRKKAKAVVTMKTAMKTKMKMKIKMTIKTRAIHTRAALRS